MKAAEEEKELGKEVELSKCEEIFYEFKITTPCAQHAGAQPTQQISSRSSRTFKSPIITSLSFVMGGQNIRSPQSPRSSRVSGAQKVLRGPWSQEPQQSQSQDTQRFPGHTRAKGPESQKAFQQPKKVPGLPKVTGHTSHHFLGPWASKTSQDLQKKLSRSHKSLRTMACQSITFPKCLRCPSPKNPRGHKVPRSPQKCQGSNKSKKQKGTSVSK